MFIFKERTEEICDGATPTPDEIIFLARLHRASLHYCFLSTPEGYVCKSCGAEGVKLWRSYQSFDFSLECVDCACKDQKKDASKVDRLGKLHSDDYGASDQIGWKVPAIPTIENDGYWGYTSVPQPGVDWWKLLPLRNGD